MPRRLHCLNLFEMQPGKQHLRTQHAAESLCSEGAGATVHPRSPCLSEPSSKLKVEGISKLKTLKLNSDQSRIVESHSMCSSDCQRSGIPVHEAEKAEKLFKTMEARL